MNENYAKGLTEVKKEERSYIFQKFYRIIFFSTIFLPFNPSFNFYNGRDRTIQVVHAENK